MAKTPYSAPKPRSLPTVTSTQDLANNLANWQAQLDPGLQNSAPRATPVNFKVTSGRGGLTLAWSPVAGSDGYEILKSQNGSFKDDLQVIPVSGANVSSFFDGTGGNAITAHYRIRTTSGTPQKPQSQRGPESGVVSHTSIDASDTVTQPTTRLDQYTTDKTRSNARFGNYGTTSVPSTLGKTGGPLSGSGAAGGSGTSTGTPSVGATSFSSIGTGANTTATMTVGAGAQIIPDPDSPGVISATNLQTTPVTTDTPADQAVLQYSAANGKLQYAVIIATGTQAGLSSVLPLALGEIYVATDTGNLFIGTPGIGIGYLQVGDTRAVNETLLQILMEMRSMRVAMTQLACEGGRAVPQDFDPQALASDAEIAVDAL